MSASRQCPQIFRIFPGDVDLTQDARILCQSFTVDYFWEYIDSYGMKSRTLKHEKQCRAHEKNFKQIF